MTKQGIALAVLMCVVGSSLAKDITAQVKSNTDFDERVAAACLNRCGNLGRSTLDSIVVTPDSNGRHKVVAKATAKYHEDRIGSMLGSLFGQVQGIHYVIKVTAYGYINASDCKLVVEKVDVAGDELGLANGFMGHQGSQYYLKGCRRYL